MGVEDNGWTLEVFVQVVWRVPVIMPLVLLFVVVAFLDLCTMNDNAISIILIIMRL